MDDIIKQLMDGDIITAPANITQDQLIDFLETARQASWDIPSAFMALCDHPSLDKEVPMHRDTSSYPSMVLFNTWPFIDRHFLTVHGLDLTDHRINWSFDT